MEWYEDSIACLNVAKKLLSDIEEKQSLSITDDTFIPYMKVDIKNFLENCRSPLDYAAQYIFVEYCKDGYLKKENQKKKKEKRNNPRIYYPIRKNESSFATEIDRLYFPLQNSHPEIVTIFQKGQLFSSPDNPSLHYLNELTNENKHSHLTKHERQLETNLRSYKDDRGNTFTNVYSSNNNGFVINGMPIGDMSINVILEGKEINVTIIAEYYFKDLNKSVLPTLKSIYDHTNMVVNSLKETLFI